MRFSLAIAVFALACTPFPSWGQKTAKNSAPIIVGEWETPTRSVSGGSGTRSWVFNADGTGVALTTLYPNMVTRFSYTVDTTAVPFRLDLRYEDDTETFQAIYEFLTPSMMRMAGAMGGPRPPDFSEYTMTWRRRGT